jgi:hypothetical protein
MLKRLLTRCHESANNAMALAAAVKKGDAGALLPASSTIDLGLVLPHFHELSRMFDGLTLVVGRDRRVFPFNDLAA